MSLYPPLLAALTILALSLSCRDSGLDPTVRASEQQPSAPTQELRAGVRVRTARVRTGRLSKRDEISGVVHAFHKATITAEVPGRIVERRVERGETVRRDQVLFRLDASRLELEFARATATEKSRKTDLRHARRELERGRSLIAKNAISEQRLDDLLYAVESAENALALAQVARETAGRALADTTIAAPFAGVVDSYEVDVGDYVAPGAPVLTLVELSRVRLRAGVTASEAARLGVGMTARASFAALGGASRDAELRSVSLVANPTHGTYDVEFWLDNDTGQLREGMVASLSLPEPDREPRMLLPRAALIRWEGRMAVFVVEGDGAATRARAREVRLGRSEGDWVEILMGLREGELAVVDGQFALRDGAAVVIDGSARTAAAP